MRDAGRPIRLGVVGHTGYTELDGALQALRRLAPGLNLEDPRVSPLFGDAGGLPPTQLHVGSSELLLDAVGPEQRPYPQFQVVECHASFITRPMAVAMRSHSRASTAS